MGAGASRGAILNGSYTPPLDTEFLSIAQKIFNKKGPASKSLKEGRADWKKLQKSLKGIGLSPKTLGSWRLETLTTYLEARANVGFENTPGRPIRYRDILKTLNRVVCHVLNQTGGTEICPLHKVAVQYLNPDAILSFNYDLILDNTLLNLKKLNWASQEYTKAKTVELWINSAVQRRKWFKRRRPSVEGINLLKLHGSMHWQSLQRGGWVLDLGC